MGGGDIPSFINSCAATTNADHWWIKVAGESVKAGSERRVPKPVRLTKSKTFRKVLRAVWISANPLEIGERISKFKGRRGDVARQPPISINPRISENALKALLIAGAGVGLLLDGFRGYQLLRRGPRDGMGDEP